MTTLGNLLASPRGRARSLRWPLPRHLPTYADCAMAFPVPNHLPRKPASNDVTSKILSSIDSASLQSINSSVAKSWVAELDESISLTKVSASLSQAIWRLHISRRRGYTNVFSKICRNSNTNSKPQSPSRSGYTV